MNNKGTSLFFGLMLAVILMIIGLALAPALQDVTNETMDNPSLNCSTTTDNTSKAICTSIDIQQLFIGVIFGLSGLVIWRVVL